ncbi:phytosulfokines 3-like [Malania oleifera]|uniref:phytosulfokines 3-like n=1 Tax=Malania oleifera TaxID=397392 RepID=UPI0025ADF4C4|nr:phytosulfokines 3-like [Malania oleifera]
MSKLTNIFMIALLLCFAITHGGRPLPSDSQAKTQSGDVDTEQVEVFESCEGVTEEECLKRRTLVAHLDYIYTQGNKKYQKKEKP